MRRHVDNPFAKNERGRGVLSRPKLGCLGLRQQRGIFGSATATPEKTGGCPTLSLIGTGLISDWLFIGHGRRLLRSAFLPRFLQYNTRTVPPGFLWRAACRTGPSCYCTEASEIASPGAPGKILCTDHCRFWRLHRVSYTAWSIRYAQFFSLLVSNCE